MQATARQGQQGEQHRQQQQRRLETGVRLWILDVSQWDLSSEQWSTLLGCIAPDEACRVQRYLRESDRRLALGSRLLQRALASAVFGVDYSHVDIGRTEYKKPYFMGMAELLEQHKEWLPLRNWNLSVSHHGSLVVIASEPVCLCGVDVAEVATPEDLLRQGGTHAYLWCFQKCFTPAEWDTIRSPGHSEEEMLQQFFTHWAMKEAFIKAVGNGLGYDLQRVEFKYASSDDTTNAHVYIDGVLDSGWAVKVHTLKQYVVCIARGPSQACLPADVGLVLQCALPRHEEEHGYRLPHASIEYVSLKAIVPLHISMTL
eukprot:TRINITY_DN25588_c0_g1_i1.p1 TRINITY_DN25588_c0_g1~~TRINITY_DN25588_c0_g1_i1.p1  ORF type:complete len:315 (-),score=55.25 TRINITY_DN25588_c0_g1_i1:12-956(-)